MPTALMMTLAIFWSLFSRSMEEVAPGGSSQAARTLAMSKHAYLGFRWLIQTVGLLIVSRTLGYLTTVTSILRTKYLGLKLCKPD